MLIDRTPRCEANVYEKQTYRHIVGLNILKNDATRPSETPFMVVRVMHDGGPYLRNGLYLDTYRRAAGSELKFSKRPRGVRSIPTR
jgi:hypothetical protein